jgi:hypothetical protein
VSVLDRILRLWRVGWWSAFARFRLDIIYDSWCIHFVSFVLANVYKIANYYLQNDMKMIYDIISYHYFNDMYPVHLLVIPMYICASQSLFSHSYLVNEWLNRHCNAQIDIGIRADELDNDINDIISFFWQMIWYDIISKNKWYFQCLVLHILWVYPGLPSSRR